MSQSEAKVTIYTCDSPTCDSQVVTENGALPSGIAGTVQTANAPGDFTAEWFACKPAHVGKAVKAVLSVVSIDEASEQTGLTGAPPA